MAEPASRPHVVMLVDNVIVGDSRVQKQARSMSERGWKVTLVGRRLAESQPKRGRFGDVPARFVFVATEAGGLARMDRSALLRAPLSYRSLRQQRTSDVLADIAIESARFEIDRAKATGKDRGLRRYLGRARMAQARARRHLVNRRIAASQTLRDRRRLATGVVDGLAIRWWRLIKGERAWEKLDPAIWDWERAYGPMVDKLKPDLIHANDHRMLHVGARAVTRASARGRKVKLVWDAHEWLEGLEVAQVSRAWLPAQVSLERNFAQYADAVVTVSEVLARVLQEEHDLSAPPVVVCNAPLVSNTSQPDQNVREVIGLGDDVPLLVYSGAISPARSVDTVIRALPHLPGVHFVMVVKVPFQPVVPVLLDLASELGVSDRVHTAPYVPVDQIVPYLSAADVGVHTLLHGPNNEIALATKYYEYAQARLPVLVTDVKVMAETTRRTGQGEVFRPGDATDLARAAQLVFSDLPKYRKAFEDEELMRSWTWEAQAEILDDVYRKVLGL